MLLALSVCLLDTFA
ncbi:hypothetical protein [Vibrio mimicus]